MTRVVPARTFATIVALLGLAAAVGAGHQRASTNDTLTCDRLRNLADRAATALSAKLKLYEYGLRGVRAAIIGAGGESIGRERFATYVRSRDLPGEFPGALGFGFVRIVAPEHEASYVEAQRRSGAPSFSLHALSQHAGERFVIELVEPLADNRSALGLDLASETHRRAAALRARATGHASISAPIELVQLSRGARTGFLLYLPLLREGAALHTGAQREAATLGWAYAVVSLERVLTSFDLGDDDLTMALSDLSVPGAPRQLFSSLRRPVDERLTVQRSLAMFGRTWRLELAAGPRFVEQLRLESALAEALAVLGTALLLALACYLYLGRLEHARRVAEHQQRALEERVVARTEEVRRANERLQVLAVQLQTAQRIANVGSWEFDVASGGVSWSDELFRVFGVPPEEGAPDFTGQAALFTEDTWARLTAATAKSVSTGASYEVEATVVRRDGERRIAVARAEALRDASGKVERVVGTLQDVTARERTAMQLRDVSERLKQRTEQAESASRAKSMFLANMSHEIRTPIGAITGLTYLLSRTRLSDEQRDLLNTIERSTKTLLGMVNDVLDLSKIEAQQLVLEAAPFVLGEVVRDLASFMHAYATGKPLSLQVDAGGASAESSLMGDRMRLMQVLTNLVGNAIKYTDAGSVRVLVRQEPAREADAVLLHVEVRDTGAGIAPDFMPRLFTAFTQADPPDQRRREGTGLGLAIVKQLVTMMGGQVGAESELGAGSRFWVSIPFALAPAEATRASVQPELEPGGAGPRLTGLTVLVADDSDINREIAQSILELEGAHVRLANDGAEAVSMVCGGDGAIDLVLMDVQMPVQDGVAATQHIRADPRFARLPILAVTAGALATERERALAAGMDDFVTKPYEPEALIARVRERVAAGRGGR